MRARRRLASGDRVGGAVHSEGDLGRGIRQLERGGDLAAALETTQPAANRQAINAALRAVETVRHDLRIAVTAAAIEEGFNLSEIACAFGISRQLVQRNALEARALPPAAE